MWISALVVLFFFIFAENEQMTCNENIGTTSINNLLAKTSQRHVFGVFQNSYCTPLSVITNGKNIIVFNV